MKKKPSRAAKKTSSFPVMIQCILLMAIGIVINLSFLTFLQDAPEKNCFGLFGYFFSSIFRFIFGMGTLVFGLSCFCLGYRKLRMKQVCLKKEGLLFALLTISSTLFLAIISEKSYFFAAYFDRFVPSEHLSIQGIQKQWTYLGGIVFQYIYSELPFVNLLSLLGDIGCLILSLIGIFTALLFLTKGRPLFWFLKMCKHSFQTFLASFKKKNIQHDEWEAPSPPAQIKQKKLMKIPKLELVKSKLRESTKSQLDYNLPSPKYIGEDFSKYVLPPASLLTDVKVHDHALLEKDLKDQAAILEETLMSFGIEAKVGQIHCGPTIVSFEVHPSVGVKVQKIKALENDIALNMQAKSIRIIAPIPGKAAVGIEIPYPDPQEVGFRELLERYQHQDKHCNIPLLLGKIVNGDPIWTDLTKMPHLIIAGATGSGKSVCINTIVMSILTNARPDDIKLIIVDPKKVELTAYTHLPHMLAPVVTEAQEAHAALLWLVKEMERRYEMFRHLGIRHIHGFNHRKKDLQLEESLDMEIPDKLPFIVCIIDELADLMMTSSSDIETPIARIAQMARAVGIHLILATQRPSREVITGLIKANFPTRIAFKVSSRVNSQIIIDENGAETLLGNGDMLFMPPGTSMLMRAQGAFIRDEDINRVIEFVCSQASTNYMIQSFNQMTSDFMDENDDPKDALYEKAKALVLETNTASTTFLQRKLKIGYARAAGLMDQLEAGGVVGPSQGAKPRKIFYPSQSTEV